MADDKLSSTPPKEQWGRKMDFLLSLAGYSVGLGNLWRFPYICNRNGGGAFLIPFMLFLLLCGLPLFFLEVAVGQYSSRNALHVWKVSPLFVGIGVSMNIVSLLCALYYNVIIAWTLYYLGNSFLPRLPWTSCQNWWNTDTCFSLDECLANQNKTNSSLTYNDSLVTYPARMYSNMSFSNMSDSSYGTNVSLQAVGNACNYTAGKGGLSSAEEFWQYNVLRMSSGVNDIGGIQWHLLLCFMGAWLLIFLCLMKGIKTLGKVRDAVLITFLGEGTSLYGGFAIFSVLGYMAQKAGVSVAEVVKSGPGLGFIAYPEALTTLPFPQLWNALFFLMLLTVGMDTQFGMTETVCGTILESFPRALSKRRTLVTAAICMFFFILGLPLTTRGGIYYFQLMDWYSTSFGLPVIGFVECVVFAWIYGTDRLSEDICMMIGRRPPYFFIICWRYVTPVLLFMTLISAFVSYQAPTYGVYIYPIGAIVVGWMIGMTSVIPIPIFFVYKFLKASGGTIIKRLKQAKKPSSDWGPQDRSPEESDISGGKDPLNQTSELIVSSPSANSLDHQDSQPTHSKQNEDNSFLSPEQRV